MTQEAGFTQEQVAQRSVENVLGFTLGSIAYLKERGQPLDDWATFMGQRFAPIWQELSGLGARAAMEQIALNAVSAGATLDSLSGDESQAEAVISEWFPHGLAQILGVSEADSEVVWRIFGPISESLDLRYEYERQHERVTFRLSK